MGDEKQLRQTLRLWLAEGVGAVLFRRMVDAFGTAGEALRAGKSGLKSVQGVGAKTAEAIGAVTDADVDEELAEVEKAGVHVMDAASEAYPAALKTLHDYPPLLYVMGRLEPTDAVAMGVVGSRRCTHYGMEQAGRFGQLLGRAGFTVVSGGARGIDTAAHRGALAGEGRTIAVMGCGLSALYPRENAELFQQIAAAGRGAIVSELPMRTAVLSGNFPTRNRIISGLSLGVLVVEAAKRSGSLITAREAAEQGREVFALPGPVGSPLSYGTNELIRDGAVLVQGLDDILEHLGEVGAKMGVEEAAPTVPPGLNETETALHALLSEGPLTVDDLVRRSGLDSPQVTSAMTMLVLKGAVSQQPGNVFSKKMA